jgi:hypothetical protein
MNLSIIIKLGQFIYLDIAPFYKWNLLFAPPVTVTHAAKFGKKRVRSLDSKVQTKFAF